MFISWQTAAKAAGSGLLGFGCMWTIRFGNLALPTFGCSLVFDLQNCRFLSVSFLINILLTVFTLRLRSSFTDFTLRICIQDFLPHSTSIEKRFASGVYFKVLPSDFTLISYCQAFAPNLWFCLLVFSKMSQPLDCKIQDK